MDDSINPMAASSSDRTSPVASTAGTTATDDRLAPSTRLLDPRRPAERARLMARQADGRYEIPETELVLMIRAWDQQGAEAVVRELSAVLVQRCLPEFQRRTWGLRHRPELMEDAIAGMVEQVLREARDPEERFMTQNFIHYLRCCAVDNFQRILRQEGLAYRRDSAGMPMGKPQHVPARLVDRIDMRTGEADDQQSIEAVLADPRDALDERLAALEAERILRYLPDPMDRQIMVLRALERMHWDDIARICGKTERTMRLRYDKAIVRLRERMRSEAVVVAH